MDQHRATAQEAYRFLEASWRGAIRVGQTTFQTARRLRAVLADDQGATEHLVGWQVTLRASLQGAGRVGRLALESAHHHVRGALAQDPPPTDERWEMVSEGDASSSGYEAPELNDGWDDNGALFDDEPLAGGYTLPELQSPSDSDSAGDGHPSSSSSSFADGAPPPSAYYQGAARSGNRPQPRHRHLPSAAARALTQATPDPAPQARHPYRRQTTDRGPSSTAHTQPPVRTTTTQNRPPPAAPPPPRRLPHQLADRRRQQRPAPTTSAITGQDVVDPATLPRTRPHGDDYGRAPRAPGGSGGGPSPRSAPPPPASAPPQPRPLPPPSTIDRLVPTRMRGEGGRAGDGGGRSRARARSGLGQGRGQGQTPLTPAPPAWTLEVGYDRVDGAMRARVAEAMRRARRGGGGGGGGAGGSGEI